MTRKRHLRLIGRCEQPTYTKQPGQGLACLQPMLRILLLSFVSLLTVPLQAAPMASPDDVAGFEVLMADKCDHGMECAMGHTLLRMVRRDGPAGSDVVFGFTTSEGPPKSIPGFISFSVRALIGIPLAPSMTNLKTVFQVYSVQENRQLSRIPLQMTGENKRRMIENLQTIFSDDSEFSRNKKNTAYNYLFDNCAGLLVKLLKDSGLPNESIGIAIPMNVPAHLFRTYNALYPEIHIARGSLFASNFDALPEAMYQFCDDAACASNVRATFAKFWPGQEIEFPRFEKPDRDFERETLRTRSEPNHWNGLKPVIVRHFEWLRTTP
ncbi:hypothetical protein BH10BDE1_BH10BDE1_17870 [soil metagenome]